MNSKQYYETVDVKIELPKKEGPIRAIHVRDQATLGLWYKDENSFKNKETGEWEFTQWLRPLDLSELISKVWEDAVKWRTDMIGDAWMNKGYDDWNKMAQDEKIKYINSLIK